jgi:hypothetical protein
MVWSEYLTDQYAEQLPIEDSHDELGPQWEVVDFETWVDWYEPHLSNMWRDFSSYSQDAGISRIVLQGFDFWDWCRMLYERSDKRAIPIE